MRAFTVLAAILGGAAWSAVACAQSAAQPAQQVFPTPEAAVDALLNACKNDDTRALVRMFGESFRTATEKVDPAEAREHRRAFYEQAQALKKIDRQGDSKAVLVIGRELWPVPFPLVKDAAGWRFDTEAGYKEMLTRRVGENELTAIEVCRELVPAQIEYAASDRDGDELCEYAQRIASSPGKRDGLYWEVSPDSGEPLSPMGARLAAAEAGAKDAKPYMGYYFRILTKQGPNAPGGKFEYVINGHMLAGFALVAWPAEYRQSGVKTFLVSSHGKIFEKDLGPETAKLAQAITEFDPDKSWTQVRTP
jgi:hypothetical protein